MTRPLIRRAPWWLLAYLFWAVVTLAFLSSRCGPTSPDGRRPPPTGW
jgi:hypothetical protein